MERTPTTDIKDRFFPSSIASQTTKDAVISAVRCAVNLLRDRPVDAILLAGDLTHLGNLSNYEQCVEYLSDALLGEWCKTNSPAFCVPGNHDIDRNKVLPATPAVKVWDKFEPLAEIWKKRNLPIIATSDVKSFTITKGKAVAEVMALNSCLGCGEYRGLPDDLKKAAHDMLSATTNDDAKWTAIERLDSPAFAGDHIDLVQQKIDGEKKVNVVLAHHNLLPQATPRAALYAELFNGGQFRSMLARSRTPTLYCHGHIHDDPIEVVTIPGNPSCLASISAPLLDFGFNVIEIAYTADGVPLGTTVQKFKVGRSFTFSTQAHEEVRIPFCSAGDYFHVYDQAPRAEMLTTIGSGGARFPVLFERLFKTNPTLTDAALATIVREAEWHGVLRVLDREKAPPFWQILRATP
jgi:Icc-related predicted phosphoesterase